MLAQYLGCSYLLCGVDPGQLKWTAASLPLPSCIPGRTNVFFYAVQWKWSLLFSLAGSWAFRDVLPEGESALLETKDKNKNQGRGCDFPPDSHSCMPFWSVCVMLFSCQGAFEGTDVCFWNIKCMYTKGTKSSEFTLPVVLKLFLRRRN